MASSSRPTLKGSIASLSISPSYDLSRANHLGPPNSTEHEAHGDLQIPGNRASAQSLLRALELAPGLDLAGKRFASGAPSPSRHSLHSFTQAPDMRLPLSVPAPSSFEKRVPDFPPPPQLAAPNIFSPPPDAIGTAALTQQLQLEVDRNTLAMEEKMRALEAKNKSLQEEISFTRARTETLQIEVDAQSNTIAMLQREKDMTGERLLRENADLRNKIEMDAMDAENYVKATPEEWARLNQKIEILIRENDILVDENKTRNNGIQQLNQIIESQAQEITSLRQTESDLTTTVATRTAEIDCIQSQLNSASSKIADLLANLDASNAHATSFEQDLAQRAAEVKAEQVRCEGVREALEEVTARYREHVEETQTLAKREKELISVMRGLESENGELSTELAEAKAESEVLADKLDTMITLSKGLESKITDLQAIDMDNTSKLDTAVQRAEEAFLQRDKAVLREAQALEETKRLNEKYAETAQKYKLKAENEIAGMRNQHLQDRRKLGEEISKLEAEVSHAQAQTERAIREKRAAESELEKMMKHIPDEVERLNGIIEEVAGRLRSAEREKSENLETLGSLQQKLSRDQNRYEKEKEELVFQVDDFYRRLRRAEKDLEDAKEHNVKMMSQVSQLEHETEKLRDNKLKYQMQKDGEVVSLTNRHETEVSELKSRLGAVTAAHSKTCQELQHLISTQHDLAARWKAESASLVSRYDGVVSDLRAQTTRYQDKIKELEVEVGDVAQSRKESLLEVEAERRTTQKAKLLLRSAEEKCDTLTRRIDALMKNEHDILTEKKHLQRQLDRLHMERERLERERSYKENRETGPVRYATKTALQEHVLETESQHDVRALQAEIERVKNRSRAANYHSHVGAYLNDLDHDEQSDDAS